MDIDSLPAPQFGSSDGCYSNSEIGRQSTPPHANSFEDEFASKTSLLTKGDIENTTRGSVMPSVLIGESSDEDDESRGIVWESYYRTVIENGQEVEKDANQWYIFLKGGPPEGCDQVTYHLDILKQVVGSDAEEVYRDTLGDTVLAAILTDEEHDKLSDLKQVARSLKANGYIHFF